MAYLCEQTLIKKGQEYYEEIDDLNSRSKNLYNESIYLLRQGYCEKKMPSFARLVKIYAKENQKDYRGLPAKVSQKTVKLACETFDSYFASLKSPNMEGKAVGLPRYLPKDGKYAVVYTKQAVSKREYLKNGLIHPSGTNIWIKTKVKYEDFQELRFIPKNGAKLVLVVYKVPDTEYRQDNGVYAAGDLGVNNLITVAFNNAKPFLIRGGPLKAINQRYAKCLAYYQGLLDRAADRKEKRELKKKGYTRKQIKALRKERCKPKGDKKARKIISDTKKTAQSTKRKRRMALKRMNRIKDYFHKASRIVVNQLVSNGVTKLILGRNKNWKQEVKMRKKCKQMFQYIPFYIFEQMLVYKCKMVGIEVVFTEESYTSKCSFLDNEPMCRHEKYIGKRVKRGLFRSGDAKRYINADLNGALNIMRKVIGDFQYPMEVCSSPLPLAVKPKN